MERKKTIEEVHDHIETMARLHLMHGLYHSEGFKKKKENVTRLIREHRVDVRTELSPQIGMLYRRYFE